MIRVSKSSDWSDSSFLVDAVGNKGTVVCKTKEKYYEIGVDVQLSSNSFTKIIKLTPYYILVNKTEFVIDLVEVSSDGVKHDISLLPDTITPFWPLHHSAKHKNCLKLVPKRIDDNASITEANYSAPFWYDSKHSSVLTFPNSDVNIPLN
jgi:vacuolar protein sorting-associated protein 13A/C